MGSRGDTQSKQGRSAVPGPDAAEPTEVGKASRRTVFTGEAEAAAEARRRNGDRCAGAAAWITIRLATGDWVLKRSRMLVVSSPARPGVSGRPSPEVDTAQHPSLESSRDYAAAWGEAAIEHARLAGLYLRAGNPEAAAPVIERALLAIARDAEKAAADGADPRRRSPDRAGARGRREDREAPSGARRIDTVRS